MSIGSANASGEGGQLELDVEHVPVSRTRTRLTIRLGDELIHQDVIDMSSASARRRFAEAVAARIPGAEHEIEQRLLEFVAEQADLADDEREEDSAEYRADTTSDDLERRGLYRRNLQLTNFTVEVREDLIVPDDVEPRRIFRCVAVLAGIAVSFDIPAEDFASNTRLGEVIFVAVGPKALIHCKPSVLRTAISAVSNPVSRTITGFGWNQALTTYFTQSVRIDAQGVHLSAADDPTYVDLRGEEGASHLDMQALSAGELAQAKRHIVEDYIQLHDRRIMMCLLAMIALAVLFPFVSGMNRFALWLTGLTGTGKSFIAKLAMNFFGDFPNELGSRLGSWSSTGNYIQKNGYFHKDALYYVDDYKPELARLNDVIKILQNYADGSARGRLNADSTSKHLWEIRGFLISSGEDQPEHSASALARGITLPVPQQAKDLDRGRRCQARRGQYRGVTADFIRHVLAEGRGPVFAARVEEYRDHYHQGIEGRQNALRIAGNFALLAASCEAFAYYLRDVWPSWELDMEQFTDHDLIAIRDEMLGRVHEQQASEIFLSTLGSMLVNCRVQISGWQPRSATPKMLETLVHKPVIGRMAVNRQGPRVFDISTSMALEAVQESLRKQGKPPLPATDRALIDQLAGDRLLLDPDDRPIDPAAGGDRTRDVRLGAGTRKAFRILASHVIGEAASESMSRRSS